MIAIDGTGRRNSTITFSESNTGLYVPIRIPMKHREYGRQRQTANVDR